MKTILALYIAFVLGWIANIVLLVGASFDPISSEAVVRVIGIFVPPIGYLLGLVWVHW